LLDRLARRQLERARDARHGIILSFLCQQRVMGDGCLRPSAETYPKQAPVGLRKSQAHVFQGGVRPCLPPETAPADPAAWGTGYRPRATARGRP
jgi:hypothetical protein